MPRPSLALVATHFGRTPLWMPAFLLSCQANPDVRWLIYTDIDYEGPLPSNVEIRRLTLPEFNARCSDHLGARIDVQPTFLKKLSDLKPTYGVVFADDLRPYDFWAYSELDIIWGDIRHFLRDRLLADHDIVSARHYKLAGHCTVFRNVERVNRAFELMPGILETLAHPRHFRVDERVFSGVLRRLADEGSPSCPRIWWEHELTMTAEYQRALPEGPGGNLWWCRGKTYDHDGVELMYLHFHKLKQQMRTINFALADAPAAFMLNRAGVHRSLRRVSRPDPRRREPGGASRLPGVL